MTECLSPEDVDFLTSLLGPDEDDDPIFGRPPPPPLAVPGSLSPKIRPLSPKQTTPRTPSSGSGRRSSAIRGRRGLTKCPSLYFGGTALTEGETADTHDPHFCTNMICISCDHRVIRFPDRIWKDSTDYLFLRDNYPDRVKPNLTRAPCSCAYCCQCTFCHEQKLRKLPPFSSN
jgi:hypothetical protein